MASLSQYAPSMRGGRDVEYDLREHITTRGGGGGGQMVQRAPTVIEEPIIEHEHHHLHHHIDHGDVNSRLGLGRSSRPNLDREYSYDDLDVHERRFANGTTVSEIHRAHEHDSGSERQHRHRHRHRSGRTSVERTRYSRSEVDLYDMERREREQGRDHERDQEFSDDVTVVDVAPGTRRVYVKVQSVQQEDPRGSRGDLREDRSESVDWRREHGVRRSRGLGNELWTEMTKDLVTREAIEELGYPYEETEYFYYIFEYLDREQIAELRDLTDDIRHERVRDIEYRSIAGSQAGGANDRPRGMITGGGRSERGGYERERERGGSMYERERGERDFDDTRTEIIVESGGSRSGGRSRRNKYYY